MKYTIPQEKLEKLVFRYLDMMYGDLEQHEAKTYKGTVLKKPSDKTEYGIMGFRKNDGTLYIYYKLINEISSIFSLEYDDSKGLIGMWVEDRYKLKVGYTFRKPNPYSSTLKIDIN